MLGRAAANRDWPIVTFWGVAFAVITAGTLTVAVLALAAAVKMREPSGQLEPETLRPTSLAWNVPASLPETVITTLHGAAAVHPAALAGVGGRTSTREYPGPNFSGVGGRGDVSAGRAVPGAPWH